MKGEKMSNKQIKNTVLAAKNKVQIKDNKVESNLKIIFFEYHLFLLIKKFFDSVKNRCD